jgi:hypothetical protein
MDSGFSQSQDFLNNITSSFTIVKAIFPIVYEGFIDSHIGE